MRSFVPEFLAHAAQLTLSAETRPGLTPIPGTRPLTLEAAICPPLLYYVALLFLAPPPPAAVETLALTAVRNVLALLAGVLFFRLPLAYHVPQSIGLTYQLGLVGLYGGCRVIDAFFISPYLFGHVPRRVRYTHKLRVEEPAGREAEATAAGAGGATPLETASADLRVTAPRRGSITAAAVSQSDQVENMSDESYTALVQRLLAGPTGIPVTETTASEDGWPHGFADRAAWALELELSMRGVGFTWTTADVRHARKTWLPTAGDRAHSILVRVAPVLLAAGAVIRHYYRSRLSPESGAPACLDAPGGLDAFDDRLTLPQQLALTAALGAFLMAAFSLAHSLAAIAAAPLAPSPLAYFPALYPAPIWAVRSVRGFWSFGWHRLFARLFLVYGVWPGEWAERLLLRKRPGQRADIGKVLGGFGASAFVHAFAIRGVLGGRWDIATGEATFFALNGVAVAVEEVVQALIRRWRRRARAPAVMWYDAWVRCAWWIAVLLFSGRNFARGWTRAGLVREMAFM